MGANFASFMKQMRIMDKDAYRLDTRMTGKRDPTDATLKPLRCTMTAR